jgi:Family of unknown function (DUF6502)
MDFDLRPRQALDAAIRRLLRPLVRVLLRNAVPFSAFEAMAKQVFVEVAHEEFGVPGKRPSISHVSILSGLTRKEVQRLLAATDGQGAEEPPQYNRAVRVLTAWIRDPDFIDAQGQPRALAADGALSFDTLAKRHSGDMPTRAVLDELVRVGAVRRRDDGLIEPVARAYVPQQSAIDKLAILGTDVADLIETIDHNLQHGATDPRYQRKVLYNSIEVSALPAFRKLSAAQSQALLEKLDRWLAAHDTDPPAGQPDVPRARVGLGIYYIEERLAPTPTEGKPE